MAVLGLGHATDLGNRMAAPEHREVPVVNARRAIFAGMIDAQHAGDLVHRQRIAGQAMAGCLGHADLLATPVRMFLRARSNAARETPAITTEAKKFKPASEIPNNVQAGSSQRTGC